MKIETAFALYAIAALIISGLAIAFPKSRNRLKALNAFWLLAFFCATPILALRTLIEALLERIKQEKK